ncbi:MAG: BamA/TamA family outer membrane protein [candidate division Zixibacteria bacterium]|nr:BamA/TamA family outer membrane protein [candidate division Zixibacteria bacterium]
MNRSIQRRLTATLFLLLTIGMCSLAHAQEGFRVDYIHFQGNEAFSGDRLREQMTLKGFNWFQETVLQKSSSQYHSDMLINDFGRIRRFYQRRGYLHIQLSRGDFAINTDDQSVGVMINVREGPPITVDTVIWLIRAPSTPDSVRVDSLLDRISPLPQLHWGMRFRDQVMTADADSTERYFADEGYPYASVSSELSVDTTANTVDVVWTIESGPRCVFGEITITGHSRISEELVYNQIEFRSGDLFRQSVLNQSQRQLIDLGVFEVATVTGILDRDHTAEVPVRITLQEAPRLSSKVGVGYGQEDNFRVFTESRLLGFLGGARRLELYAKHSGLEPYHVRLRHTQPAFLTPRTSASISPFIRRQDEPGYTLRRHGIILGIDHQLTSRLTVGSEYSFERVSLDTTSVAEAGPLDPGFDDLYDKSSVAFTSTYDNSRPTFNPDHGNFVALSSKWSGIGFGSQYHFVRTTLDWRHYEGLVGLVVATRIKIGGIQSFDDDRFVPVEDRYYSGGSSSLRGWERGEIGPQQEGTPAGGKSLIESSIELRYPIWGILSGAIFTDLGNVWPASYFYDLSDLRYSAGAGIRVSTPIGPIRLDLARPIFDDDVGYELHINVGQAF